MNDNDNGSSKLEYNVRQRAQAGTKATFRGVVAAYIAYLGYRLIRSGESALFTLVGALFIAAALGFGYYIWKRWRLDVEAARLPEDAVEPAPEAEEEEDADL